MKTIYDEVSGTITHRELLDTIKGLKVIAAVRGIGDIGKGAMEHIFPELPYAPNGLEPVV